MKKKLYELIGRAVVYGTAYIGLVAFMIFAFEQNTIY